MRSPSFACLADRMVKYKIETYTGHESGAGTDSNVFVVLYGTEGANAGCDCSYL